MKALIISALLFFSVRAMSQTATVGEDLKGECISSPQSSRDYDPKLVEVQTAETEQTKETKVVPK